jgi:hypothetical protein
VQGWCDAATDESRVGRQVPFIHRGKINYDAGEFFMGSQKLKQPVAYSDWGLSDRPIDSMDAGEMDDFRRRTTRGNVETNTGDELAYWTRQLRTRQGQ